MKLIIVSHVTHYKFGGYLHAYAPYAREIEIWANLFDKVAIAAPLRETAPPGDCARLNRSNIEVLPQRELGGESWIAKAQLVWHLPVMVWEVCRSMRQGDAIHVRCPGNLGLLGCVFAPMFSRYLVAKYAGQWNANAEDPWSVRFQRAVLRSKWWRGPVTIYGRWPNLPTHVVPFFNSALNADQMVRARAAVQKKTVDQQRHILYVGRLSKSKNVNVLLDALARLQSEGLQFHCTIAGAGPELVALQELSAHRHLTKTVTFTGGLNFEGVVNLLETSGVLVLASQTEGWPKAIVEGMAFGLVCIGSDLGLIPEILGEGRGLLVKPGSVDEIVTSLRSVLAAPKQYGEMRIRAAQWAQGYSLDSLAAAIRDLLAVHWGIPTISIPAVKQMGPEIRAHG